MKLVTASAAITALGPDRRFSTRVVQGSEPGPSSSSAVAIPRSAVCRAGRTGLPRGHPTSTTSPARSAPRTRARSTSCGSTRGCSTGQRGTRPGRERPHERQRLEHHRALMVDGDRDDPTEAYSLRSAAAVARAASAFAALLGPDVRIDTTSVAVGPGATTSAPSAPPRCRHWSGHSSPTPTTPLPRCSPGMWRSRRGRGGRSTRCRPAPRGTPARRRPTDGLRLVDGSGPEPANRVPAFDDDPAHAGRGRARARARAGRRRLAVAGKTGTLASTDASRRGGRRARTRAWQEGTRTTCSASPASPTRWRRPHRLHRLRRGHRDPAARQRSTPSPPRSGGVAGMRHRWRRTGSLRRMHAITLAVADVARSAAFYRSLLGIDGSGVIGTEYPSTRPTPVAPRRCFTLDDGLIVSVYGREDMRKDSGVDLATARAARSEHFTASREEAQAFLDRPQRPGRRCSRRRTRGRGACGPDSSRTRTDTSGSRREPRRRRPRRGDPGPGRVDPESIE